MLFLKAIKAFLKEKKEKGNIIICLEFQQANTINVRLWESLDADFLIDFVFSFKGFASLISSLSCLNKVCIQNFYYPGQPDATCSFY